GVDTEVVGAPAVRVVGGGRLLHVVGRVAAGRDDVTVDGDLGVHVEVIEQREVMHEGVLVGGDPAGRPADAVAVEQLEFGVTVAARIGAQHLVIGAVLAHDVEDVLDLRARARARRGYRAPARPEFVVVGPDLFVGGSRVAFDL